MSTELSFSPVLQPGEQNGSLLLGTHQFFNSSSPFTGSGLLMQASDRFPAQGVYNFAISLVCLRKIWLGQQLFSPCLISINQRRRRFFSSGPLSRKWLQAVVATWFRWRFAAMWQSHLTGTPFIAQWRETKNMMWPAQSATSTWSFISSWRGFLRTPNATGAASKPAVAEPSWRGLLSPFVWCISSFCF